MIARIRATPIPTPPILAGVLVASVWLGEGVSPFAALRSLAIAVVLGALAWVLCSALCRGADRGALAGALVVLALWNTPDWWRFLGLALLVVAVPPVVERLVRRRLPWRWLAAGSAVYAVALLIAPFVTWVGWGGPGLLVADLGQGGGLDRLAAAAASDGSTDPPAAGAPPDIYLVLFDEHPRQDVLLRDFGVDETAMLDALRERGFDVSSGSRSNYDATGPTVTSMLQMQYLDALPALSAARARGEPLDAALRDLANTNPAFTLLRQQGYTVVTTAPWFEHTVIRRSDVFVDSGLMNEFESQLLLNTTVGRIIDRALPDWLGDRFRDDIRANVAAARAIAATPSAAPRFVFVHVPAPHVPYVFAADGSPVPIRIADLYAPYAGTAEQLAAKRRAYADEIRWVDGQVIATVDAIRAATSRPSVIVVFGDHGSRLPVTSIPSVGDAARVSDLFAALTPGHPGLFGDRPTLVNVLPRLFDAYLGASIPILPDRSYDYYPGEVEVPAAP